MNVTAGAATAERDGGRPDAFDFRPSSPPLERRYARGPTGQIHYYDSGGSGPPLMLIHQSPTSAIDYCAVFPQLIAAGFRVLALDLPGMGLSDAPPKEPVIPDYAGAVRDVLEHAQAAPAHLVGHHTGAAVAVAAAARWPEQVKKIVLYGAPALDAAELAALWQLIVPAEKEAGLFAPEPEGEHLVSLFRKLDARYGQAVANRMTLSRFLAGRRLWWGHNAALTWDMRPDLAAAKGPLLFLTHPGEMLHEATLAAGRLRPDERVCALDYDGPLAIDAVPDLWSRAVLGFLQG